MKIEIVEFSIKPNARRIAAMTVKYYDLAMKVDLVYSKWPDKPGFAWIRMPEMWRGNSKTHYCFWPEKNISNMFQILVLKLVFDKFDLNLDKLDELREKYRENLKSNKVFKNKKPEFIKKKERTPW